MTVAGAPLVLFGAGASVDAGLPAAAHLTDKILEHFDSHVRYDDAAAAFRFVHHIAEADRAARRSGGVVDIERLFAVVDMLAGLDHHPLAPFVERWHGGLDRLASGKPGLRLESDFRDAVKEVIADRHGFAVGRLLSGLSHANDSIEALFRRVRAEMLRCLPTQLQLPENADVAYLEPLLKGLGGPVARRRPEPSVCAECCCVARRACRPWNDSCGEM